MTAPLYTPEEIWLRVFCAAIAGGSDAKRALQAADLAIPIYFARFHREEQADRADGQRTDQPCPLCGPWQPCIDSPACHDAQDKRTSGVTP
jgi:hypothetical protein